MKKLFKVFSLALAVSLSLSMTAIASELQVSHNSMVNESATVIGRYPTIDGMDDLNDVIKSDMDFITRTYFTDYVSGFEAITYDIAYAGDYAKLTIVPNIAVGFLSEENTKVYYIDTVNLVQLTEDEYNAAVEDAPNVEAAENTEEGTEGGSFEYEEATYVGLRVGVQDLPINLQWVAEYESAILYYEDTYIGSVSLGDNVFYQVFSDDEYYETEFQLPVTNVDDYLQVGSDFIEFIHQFVAAIEAELEAIADVEVEAE